MQLSSVRFTKNDFAKYPFLKETTEYVKKLDLKIEDLTDLSLASVLERAEERVEEAILYTRVSRKLRNIEVEILSFPVAVMIIKLIPSVIRTITNPHITTGLIPRFL